ncbi:hypothetical protein J6X04_00090 [Candidatus Saccharibacteria bacterium]|nr:hypothetical protein [Candidatus Saccharibacteria bacterium]
MESNQNTDVVSNDNVMTDNQKKNPKKNNGMAIGMILLVILAAGGIGFGIWAMMDGNAKAEKKDAQIAELNKQVSELNDKLAGASTTSDDDETDDGEENIKKTVTWPVRGGAFSGKFYVIDSMDKIVAKDDNKQVLEVVSCDIPVGQDRSEPTNMTCGVEIVGGGSGVFFYDGIDGVLEFYTTEEWNEKWQEIINRH